MFSSLVSTSLFFSSSESLISTLLKTSPKLFGSKVGKWEIARIAPVLGFMTRSCPLSALVFIVCFLSISSIFICIDLSIVRTISSPSFAGLIVESPTVICRPIESFFEENSPATPARILLKVFSIPY